MLRVVESAHARREIPGVEARGIDDEIGFDLGRLAPAGREADLAASYSRVENRRAKRDSGAGGLGIGLVRQHQSVAVDNSGRARHERARALHIGFEPVQLRDADSATSSTPFSSARLQEAAKIGVLARFCGNDKLAALPVGYAALAAIAIKQAPPGHAERGLQT